MVTYITYGEFLSETEGRFSKNIPGAKRYVGSENSVLTQLGLYSLFFASPLLSVILGTSHSIHRHSLSEFSNE